MCAGRAAPGSQQMGAGLSSQGQTEGSGRRPPPRLPPQASRGCSPLTSPNSHDGDVRCLYLETLLCWLSLLLDSWGSGWIDLLLLPGPRSSPPAQPPALLGPLSSPPPWSPAFKPPSELYHEHGAMYQLHPWLFSRPSRVPGYASRLPSPSCFPPGNSLILAPASVFTTLWLQHLGRRVLRDHLDGAPVGELRAEAPGPS